MTRTTARLVRLGGGLIAGAVVMAQIEIDEGEYPDAIELAEQIVETQTREIDEMQQLLDELDG